MKSSEQVLSELMEEGYSIVSGLISPAAITAIGETLKIAISELSYGANSFVGTKTKRLHSLFGKLRDLDELTINKEILTVAESLLGDVILGASVATQIFPGETKQSFHYDDGIYPLPKKFKEVKLGVMWAIDDFTEDNGATIVIPQSHGKRESYSSLGNAQEKIIVMPSGSALLYLGSLWHAAGGNRTNNPRLGVILQYVQSWLRPQDSHLISVQIEEAKKLEPKLQALLGYSMRQPFLGYVDGINPMELLTD